MEQAWLEQQVALGKADKQIAAELGVTTEAVGYWRRKFKIPARPGSERVRASLKERFPNGRRGALAANWRGGRRSTHGKKPGGYIRLYMPDHPAAGSGGYVYEHRYVMEQKLGRLLAPGELVDHIDRNRSNNAPENLALQASRSAHVKDHFSARNKWLIMGEILGRVIAAHGCDCQACEDARKVL